MMGLRTLFVVFGGMDSIYYDIVRSFQPGHCSQLSVTSHKDVGRDNPALKAFS
jgi:hypothetical protein